MKIKVCGLPFEVTGVEGGHLVSHTKERTDLYGEVSYTNESIHIDNTKSIEMMNQTFWHEVMHVIVERLSIRELMTEGREHNEIAIDQLALGVFSVLQSLSSHVIEDKGESVMLSIRGRNVNDIFPLGLFHLKSNGVERSSRNGPTLEIMSPVAIQYDRPDERVLFSPERDANPFFHLFESLWMLAGRNDTAFLDEYNSKMRQYSDDGNGFNAAYGQRLRAHFGLDQLAEVITLLRRNPDDRQAVLQIWDTDDLGKETKDKACNLVIVPRIRDGYLDWTVYNRSNDFILGALGANAVHMSIIQEYVASMIGVKVGRYWQISNCMHVYTELTPHWKKCHDLPLTVFDPYKEGRVAPFPLVSNKESWMSDLYTFMECPWGGQRYIDPFFNYVAKPMAIAHRAHKEDKSGLYFVSAIQASDWRMACEQWLMKREVK